ncbi:MAG: chemotaxis protein CheA [Christensenellales bacterium]
MPKGDSILDVYLYENEQLLDNLESMLLVCEKEGSFSSDHIADIFRILHTVKGSSAMMNFDNITGLSHVLEDLFGYLREHNARAGDHSKISDLVFSSLDAIKAELNKIQSTGNPDGDLSQLTADVKGFYDILTRRKDGPADDEDTTSNQLFINLKESSEGQLCYKAHVLFEKESRMENIRALGIVKSVEKLCSKISTVPRDLLGEYSADEIIENGFTLYMLSDESYDTLKNKIREAFFIRKFKLEQLDETNPEAKAFLSNRKPARASRAAAADAVQAGKQNYMSVNLSKLDSLMDIVGEIVITESSVTKNPEVVKLNLDSFDKASRQLRKLTDELQDIVMSIRMVPVSTTFHKMERIIRDMAAKTNKQANLVIIGEDTELDKNVLDNLSDPIMHTVRNAMDHGLESADARVKLGKNPVGQITLEAFNSGSDVIIIISDDGRGLDKEALANKGIKLGLINKPADEVTDNEAYSLIFAPGFSTKEKVTEFSGRGVGMDVALKNIEKLGGAISVDSAPNKGTTVRIRIPLTLAIISGMLVSVGRHIFILPLLSIKEAFKANKKDILQDPDGNEMIHTRGNCFPIVRLHKIFGIETSVTDFEDGMLIQLEDQHQSYCLFVDSLVGEQQTVVKPLPMYLAKILGSTKCVSGCTILGDGSVCLILDIGGLIS